jgi:Peptidase family M41
MPPASRLKFDILPPTTQAFTVVMDTIFSAYPAALNQVREKGFVASRMRLVCYEDMAFIRLAPQNPSSRFDAYYVFVGTGFVHHTTGDGTDMNAVNTQTTPNLLDAAEECVRLGLLLAHSQDGALVEQADEIFWNGRPASEVPPITPLQMSAPDRNGRIAVSAILQIQGHLHRHRYTLWPDGSLELNNAELLLASVQLAAPPPFLPFAALHGPAAAEHGAPDAADTASAPEGFLTSATLKRVAVHEAGHALVALTGLERGRDVPMLTIIPRADGNLGFAARAPAEQDSLTRAEMEESIRVLLGGRAAEELVFGLENISAAAGGSAVSDLGQATQAILRLLTAFGYSKAGGLLWMEWDAIRALSLGDEILREARATLERLYKETLTRLETNRAALERVVAGLIERQELGAAELRKLVEAS